MASYFFDRYISEIIKKNNYKDIVEIGIAKGDTTKKIIELARDTQANVYCIDPDTKWRPEKTYKRLKFFRETSLRALPKIKEFDCLIVDGDHNWYTVYNELKLIDKRLKIGGTVFLHDVCWPYARRDMYYNPERIPEKHRHPYKKLGIVKGKSALSKSGRNEEYFNATFEGGDKNGILTAVEDFLAEIPNYDFSIIDEEFGLGIMKKLDKRETKNYKFSYLREGNLSLGFDLYTRLCYVSKFIEQFTLDDKKISVLDVGGRDGKLADFVDRNRVEVTVLDVRERLNEKNYIKGSILNSGLPDHSFDIVTALELLEHINRDDREKTISEMLRLSRKALIISVPINSNETNRAENFVNNYYKKFYGVDHPWLKEHLKTKLPGRDEIETIFKKMGCKFSVINSNNINTWLMMQLFIFTKEFAENKSRYDEILKFYNKNFKNLGDSIEPTYRSIYMLAKKDLKIDFKAESNLDFTLYNNLQASIFDVLSSTLRESHENLNEQRKIIEEKNAELRSIYNSRGWKLVKVLRKAKNLTRGK